MEEEREYITLAEAANYAGIKRATIYNYLYDLNIKTLRFGRDKRAFIAMSDAKRLKEYKETPWKVKVETREKAIDGKEGEQTPQSNEPNAA